MSFEDVRNALVVAYADDSLDDKEFLILYDFYESVNSLYKYWNFDLFCFDSFGHDQQAEWNDETHAFCQHYWKSKSVTSQRCETLHDTHLTVVAERRRQFYSPYCSFTTRVSGKILNQISLEVFMNCIKHFDLSSSSTASCVVLPSLACLFYFVIWSEWFTEVS